MKRKRFLLIFLSMILISSIVTAQYHIFEFEGTSRYYLLHLPSSYNGLTPIPLVFSLHGSGGSGITNETGTGFSIKADAERFIAVYPDGIGASWNAGGSGYPAAYNNVNDIGFISALIDTLLNKYTIDVNRIYVAGYSMGAMMAYRCAAELSAKIAAIAPVEGTMLLTDCNPDRPVPIVVFHALDDVTVPYSGDAYHPAVDLVLGTWRRINGCSSIPDTVYDSGGVLGLQWRADETGADILLYRSNTGKHAWPTKPANSISATDLIWEFFKSHSRISDTAIHPILPATTVKEFTLEQNYPNPFNPSTIIRFQIPKIAFVRVRVFDVLGRDVKLLVNTMLPRGVYEREFSAANLPSGVYFYVLSSNGISVTQKMVIQK